MNFRSTVLKQISPTIKGSVSIYGEFDRPTVRSPSRYTEMISMKSLSQLITTRTTHLE